MNENLDKAYQLLLSYVSSAYLTESYFVNIFGCGEDLLKYIELAEKTKNIAITTVIANNYQFMFHEIVKLRNNKDISKILVFSNISLHTVDSLKDFTCIDQNDLPPQLYCKTILDVIFSEANLSQGDKSLLEVFLNDIVNVIRPDIVALTEYLMKCKEMCGTSGFCPYIFSRHLYLLGVWSSNSDAFLKVSTIKQILKNSTPATIQKKLYSPEKIKDLSKPESHINFRGSFPTLSEQKKMLKEIFYNREYQSAFREIAYEQMPKILSFRPSSKGTSDKTADDLPALEFKNTYDFYLSSLAGREDCAVEDEYITKTEKGLLNIINEAYSNNGLDKVEDVDVFYSFRNTQGVLSSEQATMDLSGVIDKINFFQKTFEATHVWAEQERLLKDCDSSNLNPDTRQRLHNALAIYFIEKKEFSDRIKKNLGVLACIQSLIEDSRNLRSRFFELLKLIYSESVSVKESLASTGFFEKLITLDAVQKDSRLYIPVYSPIILFYLQQMHNAYMLQMGKLEATDNVAVSLLYHMSIQVPNNYLKHEDKLFQNMDFQSFPHCLVYESTDKLESIKPIDVSVLKKHILKYIEEHGYQTQFNISVVGDVEPNQLKKCISEILKKFKERHVKIRLTVTPKSMEKLNEIFTLLLLDNSSYTEDDVEIKIEVTGVNSPESLERILENSDIVAFMDSCDLFDDAVYVLDQKQDIDTRSTIAYRDYSREELISYSEDSSSVPVVPHIINALISSCENNGLKVGSYYRHRINKNILNQINKFLTEKVNQEKLVIMALSDLYVDRQIYNNDHIKDIYEVVLGEGSAKAKIIVFSTVKVKRLPELPFSKDKCIQIPLIRFMEAFKLISAEDEEDKSDFGRSALIKYSDHLNGIGIAIFKKSELDYEPFVEVEHKLARDLSDQSFVGDYYNAILLALIREYAGCIEDLIVAVCLSNMRQYTISVVEYTGESQTKYLPALEKNFVERILELLNSAKYSESLGKEFSMLFETSGLAKSLLKDIYRSVSSDFTGCFKYLENNLKQILDGK